jgi:hypothetical protein
LSFETHDSVFFGSIFVILSAAPNLTVKPPLRYHKFIPIAKVLCFLLFPLPSRGEGQGEGCIPSK